VSLVFGDCFDNYTTILDFWDNNHDCTIRNTGVARTGIGCLEINSGAFGPSRVIPQLHDGLYATAWYSSSPGLIFYLSDIGLNQWAISLTCLGDRSLAVNVNIGLQPTIGASAPGVVTFNSYNSIAIRLVMSASSGPQLGIVQVWCNGVLVINASGLNTQSHGPAYINCVELMGPGGNAFTCYHDDVYVLDCSDAVNNTYLGALRLYALPPTANGAPIAWTPLAGANWSEVNEVPPDGNTSYNSSGNVGDVDQYVYPLTGPPANSSIKFVQHELDMLVDSGARSVASDLNGTVAAAATALTNGYHIYPTPYDVNPATGLAFVAGDFPIQAGPKVTA
jgi:hypothetical protein